MAEVKMKNLVLSLEGKSYRMIGSRLEDICAELGITEDRFIELLSRDAYCPTLSAAPTSSTLTYIDTDGSSNHFQVGQLCRWAEGSEYRLAICKDVAGTSIAWYVLPASFSTVATSGSYNDLSDKPTIPSEVTESTVSGWGFTKNTGTYSKPNSGIPKSDLASAVRTSLGKADTAMQIYELTYSQLKSKVDSGTLEHGCKYAITDYSCIYIQPVTLQEYEVAANDIKYIICTAISNNQLSENVEIVREEGYVPIVECRYDIDPESCSWTAGMRAFSPKGVIYYMRDANDNVASYDFKHIKFKRWAIRDITPNTAIDDGTGGVAGPYKAYMTENAYKWNDDRQRIGAGEASETTMIPAIFNGTWAGCTSDLTTIPMIGGTDHLAAGFHDDYVLECHKPYKDTRYPNDKYLAWQTDMNASGGVSAPINAGTCTVYGQQVVDVDASDDMDRYTFDYEGTDASERILYNDTLPLVKSAHLCDDFSAKGVPLPNTVFVFSPKAINHNSTRIQNMNLQQATNNTVLLRNYGGYGYALIDNMRVDSMFRYNLIIGCIWQNVCLESRMMYNYVCGDLSSWNFTGNVQYNTIFGYLSNISGKDFTRNLWYNVFMQMKLATDSAWRTYYDGMNSYDVATNGWIAYNILAPIIYTNIKPHFNTNTFRCCYNKGNNIDSANQGCSYGGLMYSTIGYGIGQGLKLGLVFRSEISTTCFRDVTQSSYQGTEMFKNDQPVIPDIRYTYVSGRYNNTSGIDGMTDKENAILNSSIGDGYIRGVLYKDSTGWHAMHEHGIGKVASDGNVTKIQKVTTLPSSPDENTLYIIVNA